MQKRIYFLCSFVFVSGIIVGLFVQAKLSAQVVPSNNLPNVSPVSSADISPSAPTSSQSFPSSQQATSNANLPVPPANPADPSISQHTLPTGGREDIVQIGNISVSQPQAYTGDDVTFTITIQNVAPYKKFVRQLCFNSSEGNFGCSPGFNLNPGQVFSISNSGRFTSSGVKSIGVTWTQDGTNFYSPVNASIGSVTIL